MRSFIPVLASLAVVGQAYDATLKSLDKWGNVLTSHTASYEAGGSFTAEIDLGVNPKELGTFVLDTQTYGVNECEFKLVGKPWDIKHKKCVEIGHFDSMCEWPGVYIDAKGVGMTAKLDVRTTTQFQTDAILRVTCGVSDVSLKSSLSTLSCNYNDLDTVENNQAPYSFFYFADWYSPKKFMDGKMISTYTTQLYNVFLGGANPYLDLMMNSVALITYKRQYYRLARANGFNPGPEEGVGIKLQNHEEGHLVTPLQVQWMNHGIYWMGMTTYAAQCFYDMVNVYAAWKDEQSVFVWNDSAVGNSNWNFYNLIKGDFDFRFDYEDLHLWLAVHTAFLETVAFIMQLQFDKDSIASSWPRLVNSYWVIATRTMLPEYYAY